jgi:hypothetical protein
VVALTNVAAAAPCWVQLVRLGDTFTGFQSADGTNWTSLGSIDVALTRTVAGLVVSSHDNGALNASAFDNVSFVASGFTLEANPSAPEVLPGTNTTTTIAVTPINGFSSSVGLSVTGLPAHVTASFAPPVVSGGGASILTLSASNNALPGAYLLTVAGTNGGLSVNTAVYLTVNEPPPTNDTHVVAANNAWALRSQSTTVQNSGETLAVKRLADSNTRLAYVRFNLGSFLATHSVAATTLVKLRLYLPTATSGGGTLNVYGLLDNFNGTNGADAAWSSTTMTWANQPAKSASPNDIPGTATALPNANTTPLLGSAAIPSTAGEFDVTLTLADFIGFLGADSNQQITLLFVNTTATQISFASLANTGGFLQPTLELVSPVTDFSLAAVPGVQTVSAGGSAAFTVAVTGSNSFAGAVLLSADNLPAGVSADFNPASITGAGSATLTLATTTDVPPDIYVIAITGASGGRDRGAIITLTVNPVDADGDGVADWWTAQYFGHPDGQAADSSRGADDADGDGASSLAEFLAGTNPTNAASCFQVLSAVAVDGDEAISWSAIGGRNYVVQASSNLAAGFYDISPVITPGTNGPAEFTEPGAATNFGARFYRVRLGP